MTERGSKKEFEMTHKKVTTLCNSQSVINYPNTKVITREQTIFVGR